MSALPQMDTQKLELMTAVRCDYSQRYRLAGKEPHWGVIEVRVREAVRKLEQARARKQVQERLEALQQPFRDAGWAVGSFFREVERAAAAFGQGLEEAMKHMPEEDNG